MAADRVAASRKRTHQILVVESACYNEHTRNGKHREDALAHRAGLSRAEAGVRVVSLRGSRLDRLSSSRNLVHRRLRLSHCAASAACLQKKLRSTSIACLTRRLQASRQ